MHELLLDQKIRDWVLIPIFLSSLLVGLGRQYAASLLSKSTTISAPKPQELLVQRAKFALARARRFRANSFVLTNSRFQQKRALFNAPKTGVICAKPVVEGEENQPAAPVNPMQNPDMMANMTKQQLTSMGPQMAMMGFVSYFFTGFVICRVPFPLTNGFREMLQKGVVLQSLDVSYVSSLSVYFLFMFGLSGLFFILLQGGGEDLPMMGMDPNMMQQQQQQPFDEDKMFQQEREQIDLVHHHSLVASAETRLLEKS